MGQQNIGGSPSGKGGSNPSTSGQAQFGSPNPSMGKGSPQKQTINGQTTQGFGGSASIAPDANNRMQAGGKGAASPQPIASPATQKPLSTNLNDYGPGSQFYRLEEGADPNGIQTYKGMVTAANPQGIYTSTNDAIARDNARSTASQQGFSGGPKPVTSPTSGKGGGKTF